MSNIKDLKKDIRFLCEQLILDSLEISEVIAESEKHRIVELISEIAIFHNDLIARANHPDGKKNSKLVKEYFNKLNKDLLTGCDGLYEKLGKISPA